MPPFKNILKRFEDPTFLRGLGAAGAALSPEGSPGQRVGQVAETRAAGMQFNAALRDAKRLTDEAREAGRRRPESVDILLEVAERAGLTAEETKDLAGLLGASAETARIRQDALLRREQTTSEREERPGRIARIGAETSDILFGTERERELLPGELDIQGRTFGRIGAEISSIEESTRDVLLTRPSRIGATEAGTAASLGQAAESFGRADTAAALLPGAPGEQAARTAGVAATTEAQTISNNIQRLTGTARATADVQESAARTNKLITDANAINAQVVSQSLKAAGGIGAIGEQSDKAFKSTAGLIFGSLLNKQGGIEGLIDKLSQFKGDKAIFDAIDHFETAVKSGDSEGGLEILLGMVIKDKGPLLMQELRDLSGKIERSKILNPESTDALEEERVRSIATILGIIDDRLESSSGDTRKKGTTRDNPLDVSDL